MHAVTSMTTSKNSCDTRGAFWSFTGLTCSNIRRTLEGGRGREEGKAPWQAAQPMGGLAVHPYGLPPPHPSCPCRSRLLEALERVLVQIGHGDAGRKLRGVMRAGVAVVRTALRWMRKHRAPLACGIQDRALVHTGLHRRAAVGGARPRTTA